MKLNVLLKIIFPNHFQILFNNSRSISGKNNKHVADRSKIDFSDTRIAFAAKKTSEIVRGLIVFKMCSINFLVNHNKKIFQWTRTLLGQRLFEAIMRMTVYGHFVAGVSQDDILELVKLNRKFGVKSILDYSVEEDVSEEKAKEIVEDTMKSVLDQTTTGPSAIDIHYQTSLDFANRRDNLVGARTYFFTGEEQCDKNMEIIKKCIDASATVSNEGEGFTAVKLTALGPPQLLMHVSDILVQLEHIFDIFVAQDHHLTPTTDLKFDLKSFQNRLNELHIELSYDEQLHWFTLMDKDNIRKLLPYNPRTLDLFAWLNLKDFDYNFADIFKFKDPKTGVINRFIRPLSKEGIQSMRYMLQRLDEIAEYAAKRKTRVMIDAEQSYLQPAIRRIAVELMRRYNKGRCIIFNTYQCYLKDAIEHVKFDLNFAHLQNFHFGAKLVRGAYMDQERERAKSQKYEDPINPSFEATTKMYYDCMEAVFDSIKLRPRGEVLIMIASHNQSTVKHAIQKLHEYNITREGKLICFGQLLGMCDQISFTLGYLGYSVYKYMPYGPVEEVLPYLSRRALENRAVLAVSNEEQTLLWKELVRRIKTGNIFTYPKQL